MNPPIHVNEMPAPRALQALRCVRLGLHLLWGAATIASVYPLASTSVRLQLKRRWSRQLLRMLGIRLDVCWDNAPAGSLVVANHVSWLDIYALNATHAMAFVAKSDVRAWPLVGWLAARTDTVFLRRGLRADARDANARIAALLLAGQDVAVFPEGTTTDGSTLLDFHAALLQPAIAAGRPIQPVAITYHDRHGRRNCAAATKICAASTASKRYCCPQNSQPTSIVIALGQNAFDLFPAQAAQHVAHALAAAAAGKARAASPCCGSKRSSFSSQNKAAQDGVHVQRQQLFAGQAGCQVGNAVVVLVAADLVFVFAVRQARSQVALALEGHALDQQAGRHLSLAASTSTVSSCSDCSM
jgi:1-acyl-sn-glycerol-3-phosphate acyltransferase